MPIKDTKSAYKSKKHLIQFSNDTFIWQAIFFLNENCSGAESPDGRSDVNTYTMNVLGDMSDTDDPQFLVKFTPRIGNEIFYELISYKAIAFQGGNLFLQLVDERGNHIGPPVDDSANPPLPFTRTTENFQK